MKTLDKLRGNFFNKKSFNVGFNNRSPLSYISSTGPNVPAFADPGVKSFEPSDWKGAFDGGSAEAFEGLEKTFGGGKDKDQAKALQNFVSQNPTASQSVIDAFKASLG